jgi:hypothetical protein
MTSLVDLFLLSNVQMAVNGRGRHVCMPEQLFDYQGIAIVLKQVSRKRMPEQVRVDLFIESGQAS